MTQKYPWNGDISNVVKYTKENRLLYVRRK